VVSVKRDHGAFVLCARSLPDTIAQGMRHIHLHTAVEWIPRNAAPGTRVCGAPSLLSRVGVKGGSMANMGGHAQGSSAPG
jgi:hypothetical protein